MFNLIDLLKDAIGSTKPVFIGAFKLKYGVIPKNTITDGLRAMVKSGTKIHVLLESRLTKQEKKSSKNLYPCKALKAFTKTGVTLIKNLKPFNNVHLKVFLADDFACVGTTNHDDKQCEYLKRDFTILIREPQILLELRNILTSLEQKEVIKWPEYNTCELKVDETRLSWGPGQHRVHILELIESAKSTIFIYQQDLQDRSINDALIRQLRRGIRVLILMSKYPFGKKNENKSLPYLKALVDENAKVCLTGKKNVYEGRPLHIHAKVLLIDAGIIDAQLMYLGSANFFTAVLDPKSYNLNLGIVTRNDLYINDIHKTFLKDWEVHLQSSLLIN